MLEDKLGITFDRVETNLHSRSLLSLNNELSPEEKQIVQEEINEVYYSFLKKVASGRDGLNEEEVDEITEEEYGLKRCIKQQSY